MRKLSKKRKKVVNRIISIVLVAELFLGGLPFAEQEDGKGIFSSFLNSITAYAAGTGTTYVINSPSELEVYSKNYDSTHKNDIIRLAYSDSATNLELKYFKSIGTSASDAFDGTIEIAAAGMTLNLPTTMFGYITDDVEIVDSNSNPTELVITRTQDRPDDPLFAAHVVHTRTSGSPVEWKFHYDRYKDMSNGSGTWVVSDFAGYIGTLENGAKINVSSIVHDNSSGSDVADMSPNSGDIGLVCRTMSDNSELTVGTITIGSVNGSSSYKIESKASGNAGGIVGSMASGSTLTLGNSFSNPQGSGQNITSQDGYAGGIVGKCDGGSIVFNNSTPYSLSQIINGKSGSGGVIGCYKTKASTDVTVSTANFAYNGYKVNGDGNCGALFGELENGGAAITISGSTAVTSDHGSGSAASLGGLIGTYTATNLSDTLTISTTGTVTPSKTGGSVRDYGGAIGVVGVNSYVKLNNFIVNASDADNFGGAVGNANGAFIDVNGINVTGPSGGFSGGGVINALGDGVLRLNGTINLAGAKANGGQIVNTRDYGLVFAESWTLTRCSSVGEVDDIGSWGEVLRFPGGVTEANVITVDTTNHYVTLAPAVLSMTKTEDFVRTALNMQLNKGQNSGVLRCSGSTSATLLASTGLELSASSVAIDLSGTGITGLTRDNVRNEEDETSCVEFSGTFDGKGGSIKLAVGESYSPGDNGTGHGKIYDHPYIGLFAKTKNATIKNLKIAENSSIKVKANTAMYIGNVAAMASGTLTLTSVEVCNDGAATPVNYATIDADGSASCIGGFVGEFTASGDSSITSCIYNGEIKGGITGSKIGGFIGSLSKGNVTINTSAVKGKISGSSNTIGGTIAVTSGSTITINDLDIDGLTMTGGTSCGGFIGYEWLTTKVVFAENTGLEVTSSSLTTGATAAAGLVKKASGYWNVKTGGITLDSSMSIDASSATSFGLLVNDGTALYMELLPSAYSVDAAVGLTMNSVTVFDELVAKTISGDDPLANGQGIVSIATTGHALLNMDSYGGAGTTYQHKTAYLESHTALYDNPNTRYYYNLDAYNSSSISDPAQQLLMWSVRQYAHSTIQKYFLYTGTSIGTSASSSLDMAGYSYYPVDLTGSLTLTGAVHLYNEEFDTTENSTGDKRLSVETGTQSQHYMIHNSLFRNVSGTLNFTGSIDGTVRKVGDHCGAMVMGDVGSDKPASPAKITINSLVLDGIKIASADGPLIINTASSNSTLNISGVSNSSTAYANDGAGVSTSIATSLLGVIGSSDATGVKLTFSGIKLDGRNATGFSNLSGLTDVYNTKGSLFSHATLLESLAYEASSGSFGVYNYTYDEDWGTGTPRNVTYGSEIDSTTENLDTSVSPAESKQNHYNNDSTKYTRPDVAANVGSKYEQFARDFQKYVYYGYVPASNKHELRVNIPGNESTGCGTYNDPYIITSGAVFSSFANTLNGSDTSMKLSVPDEILDESGTPGSDNETWCSGDSELTHNDTDGNWYTSDNSKFVSTEKLRKYLAGAYYKIDDTLTEITLPAGFSGFSTNVTSEYVFRGVIDGSGVTVKNPTTQPLIVSSNGSVVYNMVLDVQPASAKTLTQTNSKPFVSNGAYNTDRCEFYGAVMGQILGGDNIIDDVQVIFPDSESDGNKIIVNANSKSKAYLVPIGGYVGVVVNGGLIFRNMVGGAANNEGGITSVNLTGFGTGTGETPSDPTASDNTKWLYVNPIIGRVLNGYAVTESTTYKPFEDGSRTYPNGDKEYWQTDGTFETRTKAQLQADPTLDETMLSTAAHVTMQNGTKNYSIADISTNKTSEPDFTVTAPSGGHPGNEGSKVTVFNAQSLFIISLITESGLGTSANGKYDDTNNILKPYTDYMTTHLAGYHYVGNSNLPSSKPTALIPSAVSDTDKGSNDYYTASGDVINDSSDNDTKLPYIIKNYTPYGDAIIPYPAFNLAAFEGGKDELYLKLDFSSSGDSIYYIPDGFRGLGALLLQNGSSTDWANTTKDNSDVTRVFNAMCLSELNGNNRNVSLNMSLQLYSDDNYLTPSRNQANLKTGYGFFNALRSTGGTSSTNKIKDVIIKGSVYYDLFNSTGEQIIYDSTGLNQNARPATGAFIGAPGVDTNTDGGGGDMWLENIKLDNVTVTGVDSVGGFMGCSNAAHKYSFYECSAENLEVVGGTSVGGMIGYVRHGSSIIDAEFNGKEFGIISIRGRSSWAGGGNSNHGDSAVGGLFGDNYANNGTGITVNDVTIRNASSVSKGYVGYDPDYNNSTIPSAGGVFGGAFRSSAMSLTEVTVSNIDVKGAKSGGMIGSIVGSYTTTISDSSVTTTADCIIEGKYNHNNGSSGGFIGDHYTSSGVFISDCTLSGYTIAGYHNVGGVVGKFRAYNADPPTDTVIKNVELDGHTLKGNNDVGGLIGDLGGDNNNRELLGYNIRINNQSSAAYTANSISQNGYIVGENNNKKLIKIVGFSRQGTIDTANMVGKPNSDNRYGGGYVIFADYNDTAETDENAEFANMQASGVNVVPQIHLGSKTVVTEYTVVGQRNNIGNTLDNTFVTIIGDPVRTEVISETPDNALDPYDDSIPDGEKNISLTATRLRYEPYVKQNVSSESGLIAVSDADELFSSNAKGGFYIWNGSNLNGGNYLKNSLKQKDSSNSCIEKTTIGSAGVWYFEKAGKDTENNQLYKIFTYYSDGTPKYIASHSTLGGVNVELSSTNGDLFIIETKDADTKTFYIKNADEAGTNNGRYLQHSGGGQGIRYYTDKNNVTNTAFKLYYANNTLQDILRANTYSTITYDGSTISSEGFASSYALASTVVHDPSAETDYATYCSSYNDTSYELFYIIETVKMNITEDEPGYPPYVTTNPRFDVTKDDDDPPNALQWLTSDGVSNTGYNGSAAYNIITAINGGTDKKRYQNTGLSSDDRASMEERLYSNMTSFLNASTSNDPYNGEDFPVLVVNDISTANEAINDYLRLLTNTDYNFSNGYPGARDDYAELSVFNVDISKWLYNNTTKKFEKQEGEASLKCVQNRGFRINANDLDNGNRQISLLDVQFYDPSDTSASNRKIAYHLYVPVVVKKMLFYTVDLKAASTTTYKLDAYPTVVQNLLENLGNPITLRLTYTYQQTAEAWESAINSGENVCRNYNKVLDLINNCQNFPADAQIVLLDHNNKTDRFYNGSFTSSAAGGVVTPPSGGTGTGYQLELASFTDPTNSETFSPVMLNDLLDITVDEDAETEDKNLIECASDSSELIAIVRDYTYTENGEAHTKDLYLRYKHDDEDHGDYAVNVALKEGQSAGGYAQEHYYISIFTKADNTDTNIYHYEVETAGTTLNDPNYPTARIGNLDAPHLFLGNLYTNDVTITETNSVIRKMDSENNYLSADLTANVGFTQNAIDNDILSVINDNVKIYQTFMISLDRLNGELASQRGILVDPLVDPVAGSYKINNAEPGSYSLDYLITNNYIELLNNHDIKQELVAKANEGIIKPSPTEDDYKIQIKESVTLTYAANTLPDQFPKSTASDNTTGTYMIGYSNISATSDGGSASRASANTESRVDKILYYVDDDTTVDFSYNAISNPEFQNDGNGNYGQLGLDGYELDDEGKTYVQINSAAYYDAHDYNLINNANFVKIMIKLSKKSNYQTALDIPTYLKDFELLDKNGDPIVILSETDDPETLENESVINPPINAANNYSIDLTDPSKVYTYIVPRETVETDDKVFNIPINYKAYGGNNSTFEGKNNASYDMQYSNYKVEVTVGLLENKNDGAWLQNSDKTDHIIYTNARIYSDVIS